MTGDDQLLAFLKPSPAFAGEGWVRVFLPL
jgi:hypothetical protein